MKPRRHGVKEFTVRDKNGPTGLYEDNPSIFPFYEWKKSPLIPLFQRGRLETREKSPLIPFFQSGRFETREKYLLISLCQKGNKKWIYKGEKKVIYKKMRKGILAKGKERFTKGDLRKEVMPEGKDWFFSCKKDERIDFVLKGITRTEFMSMKGG